MPPDLSSYPNPSPAGEAAKIFCEQSIRYLESIYGQEDFSEQAILDTFRTANESVKKYNESLGITPDTIASNPNLYFDFYHLVGSLASVKSNILYWGYICDSSIAVVEIENKQPKIIFRPVIRNDFKLTPPNDFNSWDYHKRTLYTRRNFRNKIGENRERVSYGALTGEESALNYVNIGSFKIEKPAILLVFTDGFSPYLDDSEFLKIFRREDNYKLIENKIGEFVKEKIKENAVEYGGEKSMIVYPIIW